MPQKPRNMENLYKRGKYWHCKIELGGRKIHESTKETSPAKARAWRDAARERLKRKRNGIREDILYDDLMEQFFMHCDRVLKPRSVERYEVSANACDAFLTGKLVSEIANKHTLTNILDERAQTVSGSSVNRDRSYLSALFGFALDRDIIDFNPVAAIKKHKESPPRTRNLSRAEFKAIKKHLNPLTADICEFTTETGLRESEVIFLTHKQVNLSRREIAVLDSKGKDRIIPMRDRAVQIVASQIRHIKSPLVFHHDDGQPYRTINKAFKRAASKAGVKDVIFHDLRRTFTCWRHREDKIPLSTLSKLLGHHSVAVTEKSYWFLETGDLHEAMGTVAKSSQGLRSAKKKKHARRRAYA